jgi:hypothetical protein
MMNSKMMASGGAMKSKMMASGGKTPATKKALAEHAAKPASKAHAGLKAGGMMKKGYASGGSVAPSKMGKVKTGSGRDGVAERGHTKGMMPKMTKRG